MQTAEITAVDKAIEEITPRIKSVVDEARSLVIVDDDTFMAADKFLSKIKGIQKDLDTDRLKLTRPLDAVKKQIMDKYRPNATLLSEAEMILKGATRKWFIKEQERKVAEERRRIEANRILQEDENLRKAVEQEKQGKIEVAEETLNEPIVDIKPKVETSFKEAKSYGRTVWKCQVNNLREFLIAVANDSALFKHVDINIASLNHAAQERKGDINWPGIKIVEDVQMGVRR